MTGHIAAYRTAAAEVLAALGSDARRGLAQQDASSLIARYGRNELAGEKPIPAWRRFLEQFEDILVILLLVATAISATLWFIERESPLPYEAIAILAVLLLNAIMGYMQQSRAQQAVAALQQMSAPKAIVVRDGTQQSVAAAELVPGDVILVEEGNTVPADARLLECAALQTAEAALTGESLPVAKATAAIAEEVPLGDQNNMIFSGTSITYGHARAVVTATGMDSEIGRIAKLLNETAVESTPLQQELARVGRLLGIVVVGIAVVMIATIIIVEKVRGLSAILDVLIFGVALAVAAVPEGLPAVVTAVLSLGVQRMAKRNAIVRHLAAVETLGSANVIASDKTGTLTKNEMTVREVVTASGRFHVTGTGYAPEGEIVREARPPDSKNEGMDGVASRTELRRALAVGDRANNALLQERDGCWSVQGDPTEGALLVAARKAGLESEALAKRFQRVGEVPFSSDRKLMTAIYTDAEQDGLLAFTKGAPDVLLKRCSQEFVLDKARPLDAARRAAILECNQQLAGEALRTLGVAYRTLPADASASGADESLEQDLVFAGLIGMIDPPRAEAKDAVARAKAAGIRSMMITGDHPVTASVIAAELGVSDGRRAATGAEIEKMTDVALRGTVQETGVYARVSPTDKLRLVRALQQTGAIVAMTGDGVNDAPALKTADIGVAMGITGTDVSRQAADIVLADDNFATIVAAVEEGRGIFANIRKFLRYLLASNMGEVMTMFFGVLLAQRLGLSGEPGTIVLPMLPAQILWINLVTDGGPALALGVDPTDRDVMRQRPRARGESVITRSMWVEILLTGVVIAAGTLLVLDANLPRGFIAGRGSLLHAQTMAFNTLAFFSVFMVFNARSEKRSAFVDLFSNKWLWGAVLLSLLLQVAVIYVPFLQRAFSTTPLSGRDWLVCAAVASSVLWLRELSKLVGNALKRG
jgi:Ca2+-transporting ATPase